MIENNIQVRLERFDGPLSLLLHLIQKEEMNVRELDITQITKQYLDYLALMKDLNFDIAGEYLYMAASLLYIKSQNCLSEEDQKNKVSLDGELEITSKTQLIEKLEELERFRKLGEKLWNLDKKGHNIFVKPKIDRKAIIDSILTPMELDSLTQVMIDLIRREKRKYTVVRRDRISIKEKLQSLKDNLKMGERTEFEKLLNREKGIDDIVITFISLLELSRLKKLNIFQNDDRGAIYVDVVESLDDFNPEVADGFENPDDLADSKLEESLINASTQKDEPLVTVEMTGALDDEEEEAVEEVVSDEMLH
jgi:segregation and condensation protein A